MKVETAEAKELRQIMEAYVDGYMTAADKALAGRPERAVRIEAEAAWHRDNKPSRPPDRRRRGQRCPQEA